MGGPKEGAARAPPPLQPRRGVLAYLVHTPHTFLSTQTSMPTLSSLPSLQAVGKDRFRDDAGRVMAVLQHLQSGQMEADDPTLGYMMQVWTHERQV